MSETQREWITPAAAPLQRSYGVVAVSQKYQNFKNRRRLRYCSYVKANLKPKTIHTCFLCPYKLGRSQFYTLLHCGECGHMRTCHIYNTGKTLYIGIKIVQKSVYYNWKINNKACKIMRRLSTSTCIRYILVVCVIKHSLWHNWPAAWLHRYSWKSECNEA